MDESLEYLYGGISLAEMEVEHFDLGAGVELRRTFAHLSSPNIMAFAPPGPDGYHPAPWKAAQGGFGFDIEIELRVPKATPLGQELEARETIWWIAAVIRLVKPFISVPVLSDQPFKSIPTMQSEASLEPFEIEPRKFQPGEKSARVLDKDTLEWVSEKWVPAGRLLISNPGFYTAVKAFDSAPVERQMSSSLLTLWGAIEQLFSPSRSEMRFRVSSLLASYLEPQGTKRLELYKRILKLYDQRSVAAHTSEAIETAPFVEAYVFLRNALVRMVDEIKVPSKDELEELLFVAGSTRQNSHGDVADPGADGI